MNYNIIIKYLLNTIYYNKYYNIIVNISSIKTNKALLKVLLSLKHLKEEFPKDVNTVEELQAIFESDYPFLSTSDRTLAESLFEKALATSVEDGIADGLFQSFCRQAQAQKIAETAIEVTNGRSDWENLEKLFVPSDSNLETAEETDFLTTDIREVYAKEGAKKGLRWRLETLNKALGPIGVGDFGYIFARPEVGKTTFLASEVTYLGTQTNDPILWINNEQRGTAVIPRCYSAYFGVTEEEIQKDLDSYNKKWNDMFGGRFLFVDNPSISRSRIEAICKKHKPGLIVIDQLDKQAGFDAERYDLLMKAKYQWARELAKMYGPVIGICQAGGTAENKRYLDMNDVDSSHTAKQGEADWIMGIGKSNDDGLQRIRYLHFCKNKLPDGGDKLPEMRHAKVEVFINEPIARYEDKTKW